MRTTGQSSPRGTDSGPAGGTLRQRHHPLPSWLWVSVPGDYARLTGGYTLLDVKINRQPVWECVIDAQGEETPGGLWLYSTPNAYWRITDDPGDFDDGRGYVISCEWHDGAPPQLMPHWATSHGVDWGIAVQEWEGPPGDEEEEEEEEEGEPTLTEIRPAAAVRVRLQRHPALKLGVGCAPSGSTGTMLSFVVPGSPADKAGLNELLGWRITRVDGKRLRNCSAVVATLAAKTDVTLQLEHPADAEGEEEEEWDFADEMDSVPSVTSTVQSESAENIERVFVAKEKGEELGLVVDDSGTILGAVAGSPASRHGASAISGRRLLEAGGRLVHTQQDVDRACTHLKQLWLVLEGARGQGRVSPALRPPVARPAVERVKVRRAEGPLGCRFDRRMDLEEVAAGLTGARHGLQRFIGRALTRVDGHPIEDPDAFSEMWRKLPVGTVIEMVFEERRREPHFPTEASRGRTASEFAARYGPNSAAWRVSEPSDPARSYWEWVTQRAAARDDAARAAVSATPFSDHGTLRRAADPIALGLRAAAGRARSPAGTQDDEFAYRPAHARGSGGMWDPVSAPFRVGPAKT
eukprot:TRINITY_DN12977_c0_g1_i1.p1 TRINITY_DN12977_c0_g1~~TRINITY_DN12977_c0_g1_i1.p1  ORF type:complete len:612 (+),score=154.10 TRINITY_DN12977_c0_g1_i1:101-1837(+)